MNKIAAFGILASALAVNSLFGQTTIWTDGAGDQTWSSSANWSAGVPISTSAVQIGTQPTGDQIGIDTGATTVASFDFNNTLTASVDIAPFGTDTLQVNGNIANNSNYTHSFSIVVTAGATATWTGPLNFGNLVTFGTSQITLSNAVAFTGPKVTFDITNAATYGRFLGAGTATVSGVTIDIGGAYTGVASDTFDFTSGNFSGADLGTLPTLTGGLTWDSTNFMTNGTLTVVPEPTTWALLAGSLTTVMIFRRRRQS